MKRTNPMTTAFKGALVKRTRELETSGINRVQLQAAVRAGQVVRVARGLYRLPQAPVGEHHSLALAAKRAPQGVVCLLSALRFHRLTTQSPHEVWLALPKHGWQPQVGGLPLRYFWFSGAALTAGIEHHTLDGVPVRIYSPAKTVADCFKYRRKIGLDVALEALREAWRERRCTMDELMRYARICRVANVIRPYLEALT
ncbi:MAG: type IV toxin-antitoxin system AbiEi family antitoxin domain-containing protein [Opitutae bacterium]|nr:type IV toxin-antitoxin system AbiEi family antitoxin domain-containing protein [Opitutae bacterium]